MPLEVLHIIQNLQYLLLFTNQASSTTRDAEFSTKLELKNATEGRHQEGLFECLELL